MLSWCAILLAINLTGPPMDPLPIDEVLIVARTVWQEARGESREGKRAVVHVLHNRAQKRGTDMAYEAHRPSQFSGWNTGEVNRLKSRQQGLESPSFRRAFLATLEAIEEIDEGVDPVKGATHYHADYVSPPWAKGFTPVVTIGRHRFYVGIP